MKRISSLALAVVLLSPNANALLIEGLCNGTAEATVTCDTDTGLEWLDLTETVGLSANQFLADVDGWFSEGWSIATGAQVDELLLAVGFTTFDGSPNPAAPGQVAIDLFGATVINSFGNMAGVGSAIRSVTHMSAPQYQLFASGFSAAHDSENCCHSYDVTSSILGVWAYREGAISIPEPGTLGLLGLALAGLGLTRRNKPV